MLSGIKQDQYPRVYDYKKNVCTKYGILSGRNGIGLSHKTFEKKRQSGIAQIKLWYESDYDNASIIIKTEKNREKRPPKKDEKSYYQMSLKDI